MFKSFIFTALLLTLPLNPALALSPDPHGLRNVPECDPKLQGSCPGRGDFTPTAQALPYVLSPRRSRLFNPQPRLSWRPVPTANIYTVRLLQATDGTQDPEIWTAQTTDTSILYNGNVALQPGLQYYVQVITDTNAKSSAENLPPRATITFQLLNEADRAMVQSQAADIRRTILDLDDQQWAVANLYVEYGLINEAIAILEELATRQPESAALWVRLGNLYWDWLLLVEPSQGYYERALTLVEDEPSWARAVASAKLGDLYAIQKEAGQAIAALEVAQADYRALGDRDAAAALQHKIDDQREHL